MLISTYSIKITALGNIQKSFSAIHVLKSIFTKICFTHVYQSVQNVCMEREMLTDVGNKLISL